MMGLEEKEVQYVRRRWRKMAGEQFLERVRERERLAGGLEGEKGMGGSGLPIPTWTDTLSLISIYLYIYIHIHIHVYVFV